jgi:hypothetical protein
MVDLLSVLEQSYDCRKGLFDSLEVLELIKLGLTCKALRDWVRGLWNVNILFSRFVGGVAEFRQLMRDTGAVVSGGLALQFLLRAIWPESDMDVFVGSREARELFGEYLESREGYSKLKDGLRAGSIVGQTTSYERSDGRKIQFICQPRWQHPVEAIVLGFYGTVVMNFITHDTVYSLFPRGTFVDRSMCIIRDRVTDTEKLQFLKYANRGFPLKSLGAGDELVAHRRIGDRYCWKMCLPAVHSGKKDGDSGVEQIRFAIGRRKMLLLRNLNDDRGAQIASVLNSVR